MHTCYGPHIEIGTTGAKFSSIAAMIHISISYRLHSVHLWGVIKLAINTLLFKVIRVVEEFFKMDAVQKCGQKHDT